MRLEALPWLILLLPLAAAAGIALGALRSPRWSARLSLAAIGAGFLFALLYVGANGWSPAVTESRVTWLAVGELQVDWGLRLDSLSLLMVLVVTGVGGVIQIYSLGYMRGDRGFARYYAGLSLFTFAMLTVVLSNNFLMLFVGWELVGVSSYLLIGFWYDRPAAAAAAQKAFLTNRVGDVGFLLGIVVVWSTLGSVQFGVLEEVLARQPHALGALATGVGLLIFCGAVAKSAQFPLHVWLPDAMEGPTPVSALIHAATMVAAGVYMLCRVYWLLDLPGSWALHVVAWTGGVTALLAGLIAVQQDDIKRILAYSTLSQLGYMILAVGAGGAASAMFHLTTHAFFKALLFLAAGCVIQALHHRQNIWDMGGLAGRMPMTFAAFLVGAFALCGVPPFSGFFSKDQILVAALAGPRGNGLLFLLAGGVAVLTSLYMFRLLWVVFGGSPRSVASGQAKEAPRMMLIPLLALSLPAAFAGFWKVDALYGRVLGPALHAYAWLAAGIGVLALAGGIWLATRLYRGIERDPLPERMAAWATVLRGRFYFDELYRATVIRGQDRVAAAADWVDRWLVAGLLVRGAHGVTEFAGRALRLAQTGNVRTYAFLIVFGLAVALYWVVNR